MLVRLLRLVKVCRGGPFRLLRLVKVCRGGPFRLLQPVKVRRGGPFRLLQPVKVCRGGPFRLLQPVLCLQIYDISPRLGHIRAEFFALLIEKGRTAVRPTKLFINMIITTTSPLTL